MVWNQRKRNWWAKAIDDTQCFRGDIRESSRVQWEKAKTTATATVTATRRQDGIRRRKWAVGSRIIFISMAWHGMAGMPGQGSWQRHCVCIAQRPRQVGPWAPGMGSGEALEGATSERQGTGENSALPLVGNPLFVFGLAPPAELPGFAARGHTSHSITAQSTQQSHDSRDEKLRASIGCSSPPQRDTHAFQGMRAASPSVFDAACGRRAGNMAGRDHSTENSQVGET